ncbi:hypothetical protein QJS10_CPB21g00516 [Acorus calamus]|uniref:DUF7642 domain-containing protein n=1 Tax=Acorus calamus TaxID=4465 RepID=A0AAV9C3A4_ACOCL|nr:hypothetical protein QJS10_CPB21g00516 [Acorus calamus]
MLTGQTFGLRERGDSDDLLLADPVSDAGDEEEVEHSIVYSASFEELVGKHVQYDTVIWVMISSLLVLAWGVGLLMLLYLPVRRYILRKDICSRKLYITSDEIVYKVARLSFLPCLGFKKIENHIPLSRVINIVIEQGCLQSVYGIHTFRVENIAYGRAAPIDELHVQGVSNPGFLRKVIISETSKNMQGVGKSLISTTCTGVGDSSPRRMRSLTEVPIASILQSPNRKIAPLPQHAFLETVRVIPNDLLLQKLEEVQQSVKKIETFISRPPVRQLSFGEQQESS